MKSSQPTSKWPNSWSLSVRLSDAKEKQKNEWLWGLPEGAWREMQDSINALIDDLLWPTAQVTGAIAAVAKGDLLKRVPLEVDGRPLDGRVSQLGYDCEYHDQAARNFYFGGDTRCREVGTEGKLGGQAEVPERDWRVEGSDLKASTPWQITLTTQVRNIADVTIAVANGDLSKKITVDVRGEILQLKEDHQHDGRSAALVCLGSDARGARGGHRRQVGRTGYRSRRRGHMEGS